MKGDKRKHKRKRLVYLIYLRSILEDLWYFAMIESMKMKRSWLSHQAVDGKEISMYMELG